MPPTQAFDGIDGPPLTGRGASAASSSSATRRLTPEVMDVLRRRRTAQGRGVRRPLQDFGDSEFDDDELDDFDDEDSSDDDVARRRRRRRREEDDSLFSILCCCFGPRFFGAMCMLAFAGVITSVAITYGIIQPKSYEDMITPIRVAKQRWLHKKPTSADDGFDLFDRNADGIIDTGDLAVVAQLTTGEVPTDDAIKNYIRRGDLDGDLALNETEYLMMLAQERLNGKGKGAGGAGKASKAGDEGVAAEAS